MDAVQTFPIRFLMAAVQLGPVYDDLPAAIAQPGLFKCPAAYQFFYKPAYDILELVRIDALQVIVDGLPVWQFGKLLAAEVSYVLLLFTVKL